MGYQISVRFGVPSSISFYVKPVLNKTSCKMSCSALNHLGFKCHLRGDREVIQLLHLGLESTGRPISKVGKYFNHNRVGCRHLRVSKGGEEFIEEQSRGGFSEAIEQLERMARDPDDILEEMQKQKQLSTRDLQLVLVYFSQEGRDSWCALEVFDWMRRGDKVDDETMELMLSIMSSWLNKLAEEEHSVEEVQCLLRDMKCVGLKPDYDMVKKLISMYWDSGKKSEAIRFVKYLLQTGKAVTEEEKDQDPANHLMWKMSMDGEYKEAVELLFELRNCGLRPKIHSYVTASVTLVMEQIQFTRAVHELKAFRNKGEVAELETGDVELLDVYQRNLHEKGEQIVKWAIEENAPEFMGVIHEKLVAMYTVAVRGFEAEHHLWLMKLAGREPSIETYDRVLVVCAVEKKLLAVGRLMAAMEAVGKPPSRKTFSWLVHGYVKGGHFEEAAKTLIKMLDKGLYPEKMEITMVLKGLQKNLQKTGHPELYLNICKRLSDAGLIEPCLIYLYLDKLCIIRML